MGLANKFPNDIVESKDFYIFMGFYEHSLKIKNYVSALPRIFASYFANGLTVHWTQFRASVTSSHAQLIPQKSKWMFPTICCLVLQ